MQMRLGASARDALDGGPRALSLILCTHHFHSAEKLEIYRGLWQQSSKKVFSRHKCPLDFPFCSGIGVNSSP